MKRCMGDGEDMTKKLLLVGAKGMLAQKVAEAARTKFTVVSLDLPEFDVTDRQNVLTMVGEEHPDIIINCAAYTQVDRCETEEMLANRVNGEAVGFLAEAAKSVGATLVHISTDYVFAGDQTHPYREDDPVAPQSAYGRSKLLGEQALLASGLEKYFIVRTSWLYGPGGNNFVETMIRLAREREELRVVGDQTGSPTYTGDLADAIFHLLALADSPHASPLAPHGPYGIYHFSNNGQCSWYDFAVEIVALARDHGEPIITQRIAPITTDDYPLPAKRPAYSVFCKEKYERATGAEVPEWRQSLRIYFDNRA